MKTNILVLLVAGAISAFAQPGPVSPPVTKLIAGDGITISPSTGIGTVTINATSTGGVTSITGTANQITASAATGAVTLSIPTDPVLPGTVTFTGSALIGPTTGWNLKAGSNLLGIAENGGGAFRWRVPNKFADGSSGAPGLTFEAEATTGFYRPSSGVVGLAGSLVSSGSITTGDPASGTAAAVHISTQAQPSRAVPRPSPERSHGPRKCRRSPAVAARLPRKRSRARLWPGTRTP